MTSYVNVTCMTVDGMNNSQILSILTPCVNWSLLSFPRSLSSTLIWLKTLYRSPQDPFIILVHLFRVMAVFSEMSSLVAENGLRSHSRCDFSPYLFTCHTAFLCFEVGLTPLPIFIWDLLAYFLNWFARTYIMLSEIILAHKDKYYMFSLAYGW
jgi:hypothetical protein